MRLKLVFLSLIYFSVTTLAAGQIPETRMIRGSVGNKGQKVYGPFDVVVGGTALVHMIYDNAGADLDVAVGVNVAGQIQLMALSASEIRNFEQLQLGVAGTGEYYAVVSSFRGASPFRISLECACIVPRASVAGQKANIPIQEAPKDAAVMRFVEKVRKLQSAIKK